MDFENFTPFPSLCFDSIGPGSVEYHVTVARATFDITDQKPLLLSDTQLPLAMVDSYHAYPGTSSLQFPSDLAPFKPRTDIILNATAFAPGGKGATNWQVSVKVGDHYKSLCITGPRFWKKRLVGGWELSLSLPIERLEIRYEHAYGGMVTLPVEEGEDPIALACNTNPSGKGYWPSTATKLIDDAESAESEQITSIEKLNRKFSEQCTPEGFGAIAPGWQQRRQWAGSIAQDWITQGGHALPPDFDYRFYNAAHPDLQVPYLSGKEWVELKNLTAAGTLRFQLPAYKVLAVAYYEDRELLLPTLLDTLIIEPDRLRVAIVWRAIVPAEPVVDRIEVRCDCCAKAAAVEVCGG